MNPTINSLNALTNWVTQTRIESREVEQQADSLLINLQRLTSRARRVNALRQQPITLGFYGHAQEGKNSLLAALQRPANERIEVMLGEKTLDYLTHINPGNIPPAMAVRFTQHAGVALPEYPLRLALLNECELVYQFLQKKPARVGAKPLTPSQISQRLNALENRCQPERVNSDYQGDLALVLQEYRRLQPRRSRLDDRLEAKITWLAPRLALNDRAALFALLWHEDSQKTERWLRLALLLEQLGCPEYVLAPASLVVDSFMLPVEGFLTSANNPSRYQADNVPVCAVVNGVTLPALSVSLQDLAQICVEIVFQQQSSTQLDGVDLLDIPLSQLDFYTQRMQVDMLLICNAVNHVRDIQNTANSLNRWIDRTQIVGNGNMPGLIWAITSADARFKSGVNLDEGVQRQIGAARSRWGILQAQDNRNTHLLRDWLQGALTPERKVQRLAGLDQGLEKQSRRLFRSLEDGYLLTPEQQRQRAEELVRKLQTHVLKLGSLLAGLVPTRETLNQCWLQRHQQQQVQPNQQELLIDLFADEGADEITDSAETSYGQAVYHLWLNHLRASLQESDSGLPSLLEPEQWQTLCEILIASSYRLGLLALLEEVSEQPNRELAVARSHSALGDFVAWLGYAGTPHAQRPLSRINKQQAIFAPASSVDINQRLSKLGDKPQRTNASYVYDWLVALYTRGCENSGYQPPNSLSERHHQLLLKILG